MKHLYLLFCWKEELNLWCKKEPDPFWKRPAGRNGPPCLAGGGRRLPRRIASDSTRTAYASLSFLRLLGFAAIICRSQSQSIIGPGVCSDFLCGDGVVNPLLDVEHSCSFFGGNYTTFFLLLLLRE